MQPVTLAGSGYVSAGAFSSRECPGTGGGCWGLLGRAGGRAGVGAGRRRRRAAGRSCAERPTLASVGCRLRRETAPARSGLFIFI